MARILNYNHKLAFQTCRRSYSVFVISGLLVGRVCSVGVKLFKISSYPVVSENTTIYAKSAFSFQLTDDERKTKPVQGSTSRYHRGAYDLTISAITYLYCIVSFPRPLLLHGLGKENITVLGRLIASRRFSRMALSYRMKIISALAYNLRSISTTPRKGSDLRGYTVL